jgi:hypothetical protein
MLATNSGSSNGSLGNFTITFNPIGIKKRAEHATKDLEEARA